MGAQEDQISWPKPSAPTIPIEDNTRVDSQEKQQVSAPAENGDDDDEGDAERGSRRKKEEGDDAREAKRRKTCPLLEKSSVLKNWERILSTTPGEEAGRDGCGGFSFSFDTTALPSQIGTTPMFGSFVASQLNSSVTAVKEAADSGVRRVSEIVDGGGGDKVAEE